MLAAAARDPESRFLTLTWNDRRSLELFGTPWHYRPTYSCRQVTLRRALHPMSDESDNLTDGRSADASMTAEAPNPLSSEEFQALLVEVLPTAFGYALRLTRNRADAEDLVQDAALRAFR